MRAIEYIQNYIDKVKHFHQFILDFIEDDSSQKETFQKLRHYFDEQKVTENKQELKLILHLISKISDNHHRSPNYFHKIEQILKIYLPDIKKYFSNYDIFNIFKSNKRILLYLFEEKLIIPDKSLSWIISNGQFKEDNYPQYFYPEFKSIFDKKLVDEIISDTPDLNEEDLLSYENNRKSGENSNFICKLIQKDSVEEFITFYNRAMFSLSSTIEPSVYETNEFLLKNTPTLIEYAAFCGSIQIFKYLYMNNVELKSSLWLYVIHGQNPELIHFLEENKVYPQNDTLNQCFDESVMCHHIEFANYIKDNYYKKEGEKEFINFSKSLQFYNFIDFCNNNYKLDDFHIFDIFYELCKYDYISLVDFLCRDKSINVNSTKVSSFKI